MIVKFFIFLMQSGGVLLQQKSTANTDECIYSAYFEIIFVFEEGLYHYKCPSKNCFCGIP